MARSKQGAAAAITLALGTIPVAAHAATPATFPTKPVRILIGSAPGGGLDQTARTISERLSAALGQPIVIDNRTGAAGTVAAQILTKAEPDGHTIILGAIGNLSVNYSLYRNIGYHPLKDIAPITRVIDAANVLVVHPTVPATDVKQLIALAKKQPGMTFGSSGAGNAPHLCGELFASQANVQLTHVPYKGGALATVDLLAGRINMIFSAPASIVPHIKTGKVRALAVTTAKRSALLPELPTISEAALPGYEVNNWYAMAAPAGTPRPVIQRLNKEIVAILNVPEIRQILLSQGGEATTSTPEELGRYMKSEFEKWSKLIREAKIAAE